LRVIDPLIAREKYIRLLGGSSLINPKHQLGVSPLLCVARGPFPVAAAMVMEVVVGRWPLVAPCLCQDKPHSRNSEIYLHNSFFCLVYLTA
jgi:hypothetical protein